MKPTLSIANLLQIFNDVYRVSRSAFNVNLFEDTDKYFKSAYIVFGEATMIHILF